MHFRREVICSWIESCDEALEDMTKMRDEDERTTTT